MKTAYAIGIGAGAGALLAIGFLSRKKSIAGPVKGAALNVVQRHEQMDDQTLADRVRSEIFRPADAPKGDVVIDVQSGVAYLRGTVPDDEWIERFAKDARKVQGITGVKNLLHAPGTPTPSAEQHKS